MQGLPRQAASCLTPEYGLYYLVCHPAAKPAAAANSFAATCTFVTRGAPLPIYHIAYHGYKHAPSAEQTNKQLSMFNTAFSAAPYVEEFYL